MSTTAQSVATTDLTTNQSNEMTSEPPLDLADPSLFSAWGADADYNRLRITKLRSLHSAHAMLHVAQECALTVRLLKCAFKKGATIEDRKLAWEIIKCLRQERRLDSEQSQPAQGELTRALQALMPQVNLQVNINDDERKKLEFKAEHGLTKRARDVAREKLAMLKAMDDDDASADDAASLPHPVDAVKASSPCPTDPSSHETPGAGEDLHDHP